MPYIPLTKGQVTLIDPEDYDRVNQFKWCLAESKGKRYAKRGAYGGGQQRTIRLHRFIMDAPDGVEVDHRNGDGLDNRRANLRLCTQRQNLDNQHISRNNTSGYLGVYRLEGRWAAKFRRDYLGLFDTPEEAARAYDTRARALSGEFAGLNFPDEDIAVMPRRGGPARINTSGYRGVAFNKEQGKWTARLTHNGQRLFIGYFATAEEAAAAIQVRQELLPRHYQL